MTIVTVPALEPGPPGPAPAHEPGMKSIFRPAALLASSLSLCLPIVLAACGSSGGGSKAESQRSVRAADTCIDVVLCILGTHWDQTQCRCVPNEDDAGTETDAAADAASMTPDAGTNPGDDGGDASDEAEASSCPNH